MATTLSSLVDAALRSWTPQCSGFVEAQEWEQASSELQHLSDLGLRTWGGYAGAERRRLLVARNDLELDWPTLQDEGLIGLELLGNFLFDPAEPDDFRQALLQAGVAANALGDLWLRGDRGAQAIALAASAEPILDRPLQVRSVSVTCQIRALAELQTPVQRQPRALSSVEASLRLDAIGSAGFGLSRSRMAELIRQGAVRLNWTPVQTPSKELQCGDRIQLQGKGELVLEQVERTVKQRWRVKLLRR